MSDRRVIVSLDVPDAGEALRFCAGLDPAACRLKIGKTLFTEAGPDIIEQLQARDFEIFLDLKYHDIPNTVAGACRAAAALGIWMLNVHAAGGRAMLEAAREAIDSAAHRPLLIAVTVLTSLSEKDLDEIGMTPPVEQQVLRLAKLAKATGLDGVVCSAQEATGLSQALGSDFCLVTPGIRPAAAGRDDQKRTMGPVEAVKAGSHYLVIGRPILQADDPGAVIAAINTELDATR